MKFRAWGYYTLVLFSCFFSIGAEEKIVEGKLLQFGKLIHSGEDFIQIESNDLAPELSKYQQHTIRLLCEMKDQHCMPLRFDLSPFAEETGIHPWTLKKIPDYVSRNQYSINPTVTPDGRYLFWTVFRPQGRHGTQKIWYAEKDEKGFWKDGKEMPYPLNNDMPSAVLSALPGGNELYVFGSYDEEEQRKKLDEELELKRKEIYRDIDNDPNVSAKLDAVEKEHRKKKEALAKRVPLYKSFRENGTWSVPKIIDFPGFYNNYRKSSNPSQEVFGGSTLSSSGRVMIFSVQREDSVGKLDLYISFQKEDGTYSFGQSLGNSINTEKEEMAPFLASDDRTLYFSSDGHQGISIYVTRRIGNDWTQWTKPMEVSENLKGVNFFSIPANSKWAYVSKDGKLYMAYLPKDFRPNSVVVVNGKVSDENGNPISAEIHYESLTNFKELGVAKSDPKTGTFSLVLPYGEKYGFFAKKEGFLTVSRNLNLGISSDQEKVDVEFVLPSIAIGRQIQLNNLFFETKKFEISKESEPELNRLAELLKSNSNLKILVEGHTDNVGKKSDNQILSENRANAISEYLKVKHGINQDRVQTKGYGDSQPISSNETPEGRQKNRRVVFQIIE
ncbi:OmpA family protein [Leptospira fainei serovar Hurstbridge str. BUT 6]|uniref:OmpA family protein n=1 Tax=Leptospira fainei serovar Hurstbridge str. BUT 6 TaxID=1193011 RepID=S3UUI0_9LEPT|nr:OmpA family protein [Leptospira fainei]EPG74061.1 OmpA family protein [Leptospira fainei serovar Hurstbridge str. BUT 6]